MRTGFQAFLEGFPCNVLGHALTELPPSLRSKGSRDTGRLEFKCKRCSLMSGARN